MEIFFKSLLEKKIYTYLNIFCIFLAFLEFLQFLILNCEVTVEDIMDMTSPADQKWSGVQIIYPH